MERLDALLGHLFGDHGHAEEGQGGGLHAVANCTYCHVEKLPKKGAVTNNDRGKWLIAEKEKRGAKEVDVTWLKEYPGDKK